MVLCALGNTQDISAWFESDLLGQQKKCSIVGSALEYSPHQKAHKVDQIHVAGLDPLSVRVGHQTRYAARQGICRVSLLVPDTQGSSG